MCDHIEARAEAGNTRAIVLCPVGFITDHMEVKWDLDTEARDAAAKAGIPFVRVATPGLTAGFAGMVVDLVVGSDAACANLSEDQQAARDLAAKVVGELATVPDFGRTFNGSPCAPGCCGSEA